MQIYKEIVKCYTKVTQEIQAIIVFGSYARREHTPQSDVDFILLFQGECISKETLRQIGHISKMLSEEFGIPIDPICVTEGEMKHRGFLKSYADPIKCLEAEIIYGEYPYHLPTSHEVRNQIEELLVEATVNIRHHFKLAHQSPITFEFNRLKIISKPIMLASKLFLYLMYNQYPTTKEDLLRVSSKDSDVQNFINWYYEPDIYSLTDSLEQLQSLQNITYYFLNRIKLVF